MCCNYNNYIIKIKVDFLLHVNFQNPICSCYERLPHPKERYICNQLNTSLVTAYAALRSRDGFSHPLQEHLKDILEKYIYYNQ